MFVGLCDFILQRGGLRKLAFVACLRGEGRQIGLRVPSRQALGEAQKDQFSPRRHVVFVRIFVDGIHLFQRQGVLPNLQDPSHRVIRGGHNLTASVLELLYGFFRYFAFEFNFYQDLVRASAN